MTLEININTETEAVIRQQAAAAGLDVEAFVLQAVAEKLGKGKSAEVPPQKTSEWEAKLQQCIDLHPEVSHVDDSRESIYSGRGE